MTLGAIVIAPAVTSTSSGHAAPAPADTTVMAESDSLAWWWTPAPDGRTTTSADGRSWWWWTPAPEPTPTPPPPSATPTPTPTEPPPTEPTPSEPSEPDPGPSAPAEPSDPGGIVVQGRSFPSAATTGVPDGTVLSPYTGPCTIQTNDVVIDGAIIDCDLRVLAQNLQITNSIINGHIYSDSDFFNGSFSMSDSEVRMPQSAGTGVGDVNFTLTRVEVTGGSRSVNCAADCTVQDSYLHGQYTDYRGIDHESAIRMGANSTIRHNTITCDAAPVPPDAGCSAALTGYGDFGVVQNNSIDDNLIDGGPDGSMGYCAYGGSTPGKPYSEGVNNIRFTNNIFMRGPNGNCGIWGPITSFDSAAPGNVWTNNIWDDGAPVAPAN
ncbi:hypothetical protein [Agrococcus sp. Ld7]|uniref:hypothetical protein n=1 Tax=Agrococcus sp. Ld7 TaxID=649148 RepID=UPI0038672D11